MPLSKNEIVRLRMHNQRISAPQAGGAADIVRWLGAVQAQDFAGAKWGLGLRLLGVENAQVEHDFSTGAILRTHVMRPTWHFVMPEDIRWLLALTAPRVRQAVGTAYRQLGIDDELATRSNRAIEQALQGGRQLTREELRQDLEKLGLGPDPGQRFAHLIMRAELDGVICSGPRKGKQFTYMLLEERVPPGKILAREEALAELAYRFFLSRGPATVRDFAWWSGLTLTDARLGLEAVRERLLEERGDGESYWLPPDSSPTGDCPQTHLMSIYDEYMSGYQDRSAMVAPEYVAAVKTLGNALVNIVVLDGQVVGAWRRTERQKEMQIELNLFRDLGDVEREAVEAAGRRYGAFWGKDVSYTRRGAAPG